MRYINPQVTERLAAYAAATSPEPPSAEQLAEAVATKILESVGTVAKMVRVERANAATSVLVVIYPTKLPVPKPSDVHLTGTERLVLHVLQLSTDPMTGPQIVDAIEAATGEACSYGYLRRIFNGLKARGIIESVPGFGYRLV